MLPSHSFPAIVKTAAASVASAISYFDRTTKGDLLITRGRCNCISLLPRARDDMMRYKTIDVAKVRPILSPIIEAACVNPLS